jgi:hypothetical protein
LNKESVDGGGGVVVLEEDWRRRAVPAATMLGPYDRQRLNASCAGLEVGLLVELVVD